MEQAFKKIDLFIPSSTINANQGSKTKILLKNTTIIRWNKVKHRVKPERLQHKLTKT